MAVARDTTIANVKPLEGAIVRRFTVGSTLVPGEVAAMSSDGYIDPADVTSASVQIVGIVLPRGGIGGPISSFAAGDRCDVVVFGPVVCTTGGTPGKTVHATNTAGEPGESAGSNAGIVGFSESAAVVFVRPVTPTV